MTDETDDTSTPTWLGYADPAALTEEGRHITRRLADAARAADWPAVFAVLDENADLVNLARPGGRSGFAPLHQAAYHGDAAAAHELLRRGAWLSLPTASGELAHEIAQRRGHARLAEELTPPDTWRLTGEACKTLELFLHALIRVRADDLVTRSAQRLPPVVALTGMRVPRLWFPIPGMYGGFLLELCRAGNDPLLQADSWCRVASGSEERHHITLRGIEQRDMA